MTTTKTKTITTTTIVYTDTNAEEDPNGRLVESYKNDLRSGGLNVVDGQRSAFRVLISVEDSERNMHEISHVAFSGRFGGSIIAIKHTAPLPTFRPAHGGRVRI